MIKKKTYSWPLIILFIILFFPVGIYLIYKRYENNSKGLKNSGVFFIGIGLFYTLMGALGELETTEGTSIVSGIIAMLFIFGSIGLFFLVSSAKVKKCGEKFDISTDTQQMQTKAMTCKSCGANNTVIIGRASDCEYCGSPII